VRPYRTSSPNPNSASIFRSTAPSHLLKKRKANPLQKMFQKQTQQTQAAQQEEEDKIAEKRRDEERKVEEGRRQNRETLAMLEKGQAEGAQGGASGMADTAEDDDNSCVICMDKKRNCVLIPCKHMCVCSGCAKEGLVNCPMCREEITDSMEVFM